MRHHYGFVMMVKEKWWIEFCQRHREGKKTYAFVTRGAAPPKNTRALLFYVTKPISALGGYADFVERNFGAPEELWDKYGDESVLKSKEVYEGFIGAARNVSFIRFTNLQEAVNPVPLSSLRMFLGVKRLSRKGFYVNKDVAEKLISIMR